MKLTAQEVKMICEEYKLKEGDEMRYDDTYYNYLLALNKLEQVEFVIYCLYIYFSSERKVAKILGVSRTPVHKMLQQIKGKILNNLCF